MKLLLVLSTLAAANAQLFSGGLTDCVGQTLMDADCQQASLGYTTCADWLGDGSCDNGLTLSDSDKQIFLNCPTFMDDNGDCTNGAGACGDDLGMDATCSANIPAGSVEDCWGQILSDSDCQLASLGYTTCAQWLGDASCDGGQYVSDSDIIMNWNCAAFGFDGGDCGAHTPMPSTPPTNPPSPMPSPMPTEEPTSSPSPKPSPMPTNPPSPMPSPMPTNPPSPMPSPMPTNPPSPMPSPMPSMPPSPMPTDTPTPEPTPSPTPYPTPYPTFSDTPAPTPNPTLPPTPFPSPAPTPFPSQFPSRPPTTAFPTPAPTNPPTVDLCTTANADPDTCNTLLGPHTSAKCFYQTWDNPAGPAIGTCNNCAACDDYAQAACFACILEMSLDAYCALGYMQGCPATNPPTPVTTPPPTPFPCGSWDNQPFICDLDPACFTMEQSSMAWPAVLVETDGNCLDCGLCTDLNHAACMGCVFQMPMSSWCAANPGYFGCAAKPTPAPTPMPLPQNCDLYSSRTDCLNAGCSFGWNQCFDGVNFPCSTSTKTSCQNNPNCNWSLLQVCLMVTDPDTYDCQEIDALPTGATFTVAQKKTACEASFDASGLSCLYDTLNNQCVDHQVAGVCADFPKAGCNQAHKSAPPPSDGPCVWGTASRQCFVWQETKCKRLVKDGPIGDPEQDCIALGADGCKPKYKNGVYKKCKGKLRL